MSRSLRDIQNDFQAYVLDGAGDRHGIASDIAAQRGLPAADRLAIYHNAYRLRLHEALSDAFGKTHAYIGDDAFGELCAAYLHAYPSYFRNLRWYGDSFAAFLAHALPEHPVVAELAAFEWALGLSFDAADAPVLHVDDLRSGDTDWERIGFRLQPSLQFLPMRWNAVAIWLALDQEQAPPDASAASTVQWLVWRKELQPHFRSLTDYEAQALLGLQQGSSFAGVCTAAAASAGDDDITTQIAGWLQSWLNDAVLAGITLKSAGLPTSPPRNRSSRC